MDRLLEATARAEQSHFWWRGFRAFVRPALWQATGGRAERVLDVGCGTGANLPLLRGLGPSVGLDLTWRGLAFARDRGERAVVQGSAAALPFAHASFDLVTSFDMLQTLPDAVERHAMAEMARVLKPGGHLLLTVSAMDVLRGNHSVLSREVRRYTRARLEERFARAGLVPTRVTYTNAVLVPVLAPLRFAQRLRGLAASDEDARAARESALPPGPVNAGLTALLYLEAAVVRAVDLPFGSSLLAVARKPVV